MDSEKCQKMFSNHHEVVEKWIDNNFCEYQPNHIEWCSQAIQRRDNDDKDLDGEWRPGDDRP